MPKRSSKTRLEVNQLAADILAHAVGQPEPTTPKGEKNPAAVALGKLGGVKGGKARAASLSKAKRSEIAKKGAKARWQKARK